jgi:hypothetical protein
VTLDLRNLYGFHGGAASRRSKGWAAADQAVRLNHPDAVVTGFARPHCRDRGPGGDPNAAYGVVTMSPVPVPATAPRKNDAPICRMEGNVRCGASVSDASVERRQEQQQTRDRRERKDCRSKATTARRRRPNQADNACGRGGRCNDDEDPCSRPSAVFPHRRAATVVLVLLGETENQPPQASEDGSGERDQDPSVFEQTRPTSEGANAPTTTRPMSAAVSKRDRMREM